LEAAPFCECGFPLFLNDRSDETATGRGSPRVPGEDGPVAPAGDLRPPPPADRDRTAELPAGPLTACPSGHPNDPSRTLCATCGQRLRPAMEPWPAAPVDEATAPAERRWLLLAAVALAVLVLGASLLWNRYSTDAGPPSSARLVEAPEAQGVATGCRAGAQARMGAPNCALKAAAISARGSALVGIMSTAVSDVWMWPRQLRCLTCTPAALIASA
jgi:hypothetical protein